MLRLVLILALAIAPAVGVRECASPCTDDTEQAGCPPTCADCVACTHAPMFDVSGEPGPIAAAPARNAVPEARFSVPQVDPRKVRHVPKSGASSRS